MIVRKDVQKPRKKRLTLREQEELTRMRFLVRLCILVAALGAFFIGYDLFKPADDAAVPVDMGDPKGSMAEWMQSGFIRSFADGGKTIVVDEELWNLMKPARRDAVAMLIKTYYLQRKGGVNATIILKGDVSQRVLYTIERMTSGGKKKPTRPTK